MPVKHLVVVVANSAGWRQPIRMLGERLQIYFEELTSMELVEVEALEAEILLSRTAWSSKGLAVPFCGRLSAMASS